MAQVEAAPRPGRSTVTPWAVALFVAVALAGTFYAKWHPYFGKALHVAVTHSLGASIVSGRLAGAPAVGWAAAWQYMVVYGKDIWVALIVGLLIGSGVQALLPRDWLLRVLGGRRAGAPLAMGLIAVPSMMCTCCSAPVAVGLARSRASVGATLAYWLGNPLLNPATAIFMGFVLGWGWVVLRLAVAAPLVFGTAYLAQRWFAEEDLPAEAAARRDAALAAPPDARPVLLRWGDALWRLAVGLVPEYAVVVLALGAARAWLFPAMTPAVGHAAWLVLVLAVTGALFVVPTAGEVPIVQTLMRFGLGTGAAGTLLLTLPAISLPSLVMLGRAVPARVLGFVVACTVAAGLLAAVAAVALRL